MTAWICLGPKCRGMPEAEGGKGNKTQNSFQECLLEVNLFQTKLPSHDTSKVETEDQLSFVCFLQLQLLFSPMWTAHGILAWLLSRNFASRSRSKHLLRPQGEGELASSVIALYARLASPLFNLACRFWQHRCICPGNACPQSLSTRTYTQNSHPLEHKIHTKAIGEQNFQTSQPFLIFLIAFPERLAKSRLPKSKYQNSCLQKPE